MAKKDKDQPAESISEQLPPEESAAAPPTSPPPPPPPWMRGRPGWSDDRHRGPVFTRTPVVAALVIGVSIIISSVILSIGSWIGPGHSRLVRPGLREGFGGGQQKSQPYGNGGGFGHSFGGQRSGQPDGKTGPSAPGSSTSPNS